MPAPFPPLYHPDMQYCAGILEQSMGASNRVGIGLSYQPSSLELIPGLLKNVKIPALVLSST